MNALAKYIELKGQEKLIKEQMNELVFEANVKYLANIEQVTEDYKQENIKLIKNSPIKKYKYSNKLTNMETELKKLKKIEELDGTAEDITKPIDTETSAAFKVQFVNK